MAPHVPTQLERLRALRALVDAGKRGDFVVVMPTACGKSVALFDWGQAEIRVKAPRGVHAESVQGASA